MAKVSNHNQEIPQSVIQQVQNLLNEVMAALQPYMLALTPEERRSMLVMGDKTVSFVEKAYDFAVQNPTLAPSYLDMEAFEIDKADATNLRTLANTAKQILQCIEDTEMSAGSEAYQAALIFYNSVKLATGQDVVGAKAVFEELRKRFPRLKSSTSEAETETNPEPMKKSVNTDE